MTPKNPWEAIADAMNRADSQDLQRKVRISSTRALFFYQALFCGDRQTLVKIDATGTMMPVWGNIELCGGKV